nr:ATP-binding protein [Halomonas cerina]
MRYPLRLKLGAVAALLLLTAALVVVGLVAWRHDSLAESVGGDAAWHAYKLDRDAVEMRIYLARPDLPENALEALRLRFELLYSRLTLLEQSDIRELLATIAGAASLVENIRQQLTELDELLSDLEGLSGGDKITLVSRLSALSAVTERLLIAINGRLAEAATREREHLQGLYALLMALILGMSLAAMLVVTFLFREVRDHATARRALETLSGELEMTARRAQSASQAKSAFLATVSHEIRTPLNGVIGMSELLVGQPLPGPTCRYVDTIHDSARRLLELINDLLDFSKIEAGRLDLETRAFCLAPLVEGAVTLFTPQARVREIRLVSRLDPALPSRVVSDPGRLRQVLLNLLSNAVKFTEQGEVRLTVGATPANELRFEVTDTGCGIPASQQASLFEPFQQGDPSTSRRFGGTGLGLAISKQLVEALGGRIGLASEPGAGSRFWCVLPLVVAGPADTEEAIPPVTWRHPEAVRLLVVEDNPVNQQVAVAMLERLGCRVRVAASGGEALSQVARERFDLIFMDVQMPDQDGLAVTRALRARGGWLAEVPVVAMTAGGGNGDRARCLAAGMNGYLAKPLLQATLGNVLQRHLLPATAPPEPPGAPGTAGDVLDDEVLAGLHATLDDAGLAALIRLFGEQVEERLEQLTQALVRREGGEAGRLAHQLKGESASLGAVAVAGLAARLEDTAMADRLAEAEMVLASLKERVTTTLAALAAALPAE